MNIRCLFLMGFLLLPGCLSGHVDDRDAVEDTTDVCAAVSNPCASAGAQCENQTAVVCTTDVNGCLVESRMDCQVAGETCSAGQCRAPVDCSGVSNPCTSQGRQCEGDSLVVCAQDARGCLVETRTDCTTSGGRCDSELSPPACSGGSCEDTCFMVPGGADERTCTSDKTAVTTCEYVPAGCFQEVVTICPNGGSCREPNPGQAICEDPCEDDPGCANIEPGSARCLSSAIATCVDWDEDGCVERLITDCGAGACDDTSGSPVCTVPAEVILGTNESFTGPETFVPFADGGEIPVVLGFQGSWMVVAALQTRGLLTSPIHFSCEAVIPEVSSASLQLAEQSLRDGQDGYFYYLDFFLDLGLFEAPEDGLPITVTCTVTDALDVSRELSVSGTVQVVMP